ncbi:MAG: hypothetical protein WD225_04590 [Ilumatobacteraceae bacterium]
MTGSDLLTLLVVVVVGGALIWLAFRLEPHWVSKDGNRFICRGQLIDDHGITQGRWHEYRFRVTDAGEVAASRRSFVGRSGIGSWRVVARSDDPPRRKEVFLLHPARDADSMLAVRMPAGSRAVETLDRLIER